MLATYKQTSCILFFFFLLVQTSAQQVLPENPLPARSIKSIQRKDAIIVYDFNSKLMEFPDHIYQVKTSADNKTIQYKTVRQLWYNRRVTLKVVINPYLYDVKISSRQALDGGLIDTMGMRMFTSTVLTLSENRHLLDSVKNNVSAREPAATPKPTDEVVDSVATAIGANVAEKRKIATLLMPAPDANDISNRVMGRTITAFNFSASAARNIVVQDELDAITVEKRKYENYKLKEDAFHGKTNSFFDATKLLQSYYDTCENATLKCLQDKASPKQLLDNINVYLGGDTLADHVSPFLNNMSSRFYNYKTNMDAAYRAMQIAYSELEDAVFTSRYYEGISLKHDSVSKVNTDTLYAQFTRLKPEVISKGLMMMLTNLQNPESFVFTDPTTLLGKDTVVYTIDTKPSSYFAPLAAKYGIRLYSNDSFDYRVPVKGNFKVNFSVGAAFMFSGLKEKEYHYSTALENLTGDSSLVKIQERKGASNFLPALAAYVHGYLKLGGWFTPAITIGLSTNPTDFTNASYFLGGSLICGQQSRLIFTIGRAGSSINVLKPQYEAGKDYYKKELINVQETDLVKKAFRSGWFFGVSYNVSSNR